MAEKDTLGDLIRHVFKEDAKHVTPPRSWDDIKDEVFKRAAEEKNNDTPSVSETTNHDAVPRDDAIGNLIAYSLKKDAEENAPPAGMRENISRMIAEHSLHDAPAGSVELQASNNLYIAETLSREVHGNSVLEATVKTGDAATRLHSIAEMSGKDMLAVTAGGVMIASGESKAMEETCKKFAAQRCDVSLNDGSVVTGLMPREGQGLERLAHEIKDEYARQSAIEKSRELGMKSFKEYDGITFTQGAADQRTAAQIQSEMGSEFKNVCSGYRNGPYFECTMDGSSKLGQKMVSSHEDALASSTNPQTVVFRFNDAQGLQAFVNEANRVAIELPREHEAALRSQVEQNGITEHAGVTIAKAHGLTLQDAAIAHQALGADHKNTLVTHAVGEKMEVLVDAKSDLGQALASKYGDNLVSTPNPDVHVFRFDSKADAVDFCNDANDMGQELGMDERDAFDDVPSLDD